MLPIDTSVWIKLFRDRKGKFKTISILPSPLGVMLPEYYELVVMSFAIVRLYWNNRFRKNHRSVLIVSLEIETTSSYRALIYCYYMDDREF